MPQLCPCLPDLHLQCDSTEKRAQGKPCKGHIRVEADAESDRLDREDPAAKLIAAKWTELMAVAGSRVRANAGPLEQRDGERVCRVLLPEYVSDNAHPESGKAARGPRPDGAVGGGILFGLVIMRLHDDTARNATSGESTRHQYDIWKGPPR